MDTLIENGDYKCGINGLPVTIMGRDEVMQRVKICLKVPRGSFMHNKDFGSRFRTLTIDSSNQLALSMAQQALEDIPQVKVVSTQILKTSDTVTAVKVTVSLDNINEEVIVKL